MRITKLVQLAACAAFVAASAPLGAAPVTVKGEVVDVACYTKDNANKGDAHKGCTEDCAKKGKPLALVTADGQVYAIVGDYAANKNAKLVPMLSVPGRGDRRGHREGRHEAAQRLGDEEGLVET